MMVVIFVPFPFLNSGQSWSWSYGSCCFYNYPCNLCLSPLKCIDVRHVLWGGVPV